MPTAMVPLLKHSLGAGRTRQRHAHRLPHGVSLVELMIGMALGLVVTLVVAQVLSFAEGQKRITSGGSDAQVNGALALYTLQRELQMAGYGLTGDRAALGCPIQAKFGNSGAVFSWALTPVTITDGANGAPDEITILSASRPFSVPLLVTVDHANAGDRFVVRSPIGVAVGDLLIAVPDGYAAATNWCTAFNVSSLSGTNQLVHANGAGAPWNQSGASSIMPTTGYPAGTMLVNAGQLINRSFGVSAANALRQRTLNLATAATDEQVLFPQVVNLQALYGKDTDNDGVVDTYDTTTPTTNALWRQVLAIRLAVVTRSTQYDKQEVTPVAPVWDVGTSATVTGAASCGTSKCLTLKVDGLADWKHYRYTVFDVVAPLRNLLWGGA
jgi:type IV pilus assembly protein PilW